MCSDRLQPFVPTVVPHFERHRQLELCRHTRELLLGASVATLGRNLSSLIVINESHLRTVLAEFADYYNRDRPHRSLRLQSPIAPAPQSTGRVVSLSQQANSDDDSFAIWAISVLRLGRHGSAVALVCWAASTPWRWSDCSPWPARWRLPRRPRGPRRRPRLHQHPPLRQLPP